MIGYVLLIAIAIALSTAVFFYLKLYLPSNNPECDVDIKITIDSVFCGTDDDGKAVIKVNVTNRGLFKIDGAFIKIGDVGRTFKTELNPTRDVYDCDDLSDRFLNPGKMFCFTYNVDNPTTLQGNKEISVQPVVFVDNNPVLCSDAVVSKTVVCT